jgi:hypothetical protein
MNVPCKTPHPPEFIFELSELAALHDLNIFNKYSNDIGKALRANENSPLGYGSKFLEALRTQEGIWFPSSLVANRIYS